MMVEIGGLLENEIQVSIRAKLSISCLLCCQLWHLFKAGSENKSLLSHWYSNFATSIDILLNLEEL